MDGRGNSKELDISLKYCPKCGSSDISPSENGDLTNETSNTRGMSGGVNVSGANLQGHKSQGNSKTIHSDLPRKYVCVDCGYKFDNGDFLTIFNKIFIPSELFPNSYKILTGEKDFQELVLAIAHVKDAVINSVSNSPLDKPLAFTVKIFGRKYKITTRKSFDLNEEKVWYILEQISRKEGI
jgi:predicted RNA-binding Zn-ribbon protein involved in translation (DUF1610 family)